MRCSGDMGKASADLCIQALQNFQPKSIPTNYFEILSHYLKNPKNLVHKAHE